MATCWPLGLASGGDTKQGMTREDLENWLDEYDPTHLGDRLADLAIQFEELAQNPDPVVSRLAKSYLVRVQKLVQDIENHAEIHHSDQGNMDSD